MSAHSEVFLTKIGTLIGVILGTSGVLVGLNSLLSTALLFLSIVSAVLVIAVNWDKGTTRIKQGIKNIKLRKGK